MEVILKQDIDKLGHKDDLIKVSDGYARNFLIPKKLAVVATESVKKMYAENMKQRQHKEEKLRKEAEEKVSKMKDLKLTIGTKTSSKGKIFGSVNNIQIAEELAKAGFAVDRKNIILSEEQIKEVGSYKAKVKIYKDIVAEIAFDVVSE